MSRPRRLSAAYAFVVLVLSLASLVDIPGLVTLGPTSGLAAATLLVLVTGFSLGVLRWAIPKAAVKLAWPFAVFWLWACVSLAWYEVTLQGLQRLTVWAGFLSCIAVAAVAAHARPTSVRSGLCLMTRLGWLTVVLYTVWSVSGGVDPDVATASLFLLIPACVYVVRWKQGDVVALMAVVLLVSVMLWMRARGPAIAGTLLVLLGEALLGGRWRLARLTLLAALGTALLVAAVLFYAPLREAFFGGDQAVRIGAIALNTSGRLRVWQGVYESFTSSPFVGHGVGSSTYVVNDVIGNRIDHPHNDYLRILHDFGGVGLLLWSFAYGRTLTQLRRRMNRARRAETPGTECNVHMVALLCLTIVGVTMLVDNSMVYPYIMYPLGILLGLSAGLPHSACS